VVNCLSDMILESFHWICVDGLKVVFTYEVLYFSVVLLCFSGPGSSVGIATG
jgi:hypothetical protein